MLAVCAFFKRAVQCFKKHEYNTDTKNRKNAYLLACDILNAYSGNHFQHEKNNLKKISVVMDIWSTIHKRPFGNSQHTSWRSVVNISTNIYNYIFTYLSYSKKDWREKSSTALYHVLEFKNTFQHKKKHT